MKGCGSPTAHLLSDDMNNNNKEVSDLSFWFLNFVLFIFDFLEDSKNITIFYFI